MDHLFTPWRYRYVTGAKSRDDCEFCAIMRCGQEQDEENCVVHRGAHNFLVLNIFPYNPAHLLVVPYVHVAWLTELDADAMHEMIDLTARTEGILQEAYKPGGFNIGVNQGKCGGAGIHQHLHLHLVPRWEGDTNFMTVTGATRVLPEELNTTWRKLRERLKSGD